MSFSFKKVRATESQAQRSYYLPASRAAVLAQHRWHLCTYLGCGGPVMCRVLPLTTWAGWVTIMEPARQRCVGVKAHAHSGTGIQEVQVPTSFPPLPSHVQHLIAHEAQADPLFYLFLKISCTQERKLTSSILQMKRLRHRKEKSSSGSWTKLTFPDDSVLHHSLLYPCSWSNTPPTQPSYCTGPSGTAYSDRSRWVSGQSILWGPRGSSLHGELHSQ